MTLPPTGNLFGGADTLTIELEPREAASGTDKAVALPSENRSIIVRVPAGVVHGTVLRLSGPDANNPAANKDIYVRVLIKTDAPQSPPGLPTSGVPTSGMPTSGMPMPAPAPATNSMSTQAPNPYAAPAANPYGAAPNPYVGQPQNPYAGQPPNPYAGQPQSPYPASSGFPSVGSGGMSTLDTQQTGALPAVVDPPWQPLTQTMPAKKRSVWPAVAIAVVVLALLAGGGAYALTRGLGKSPLSAGGTPTASASPTAKPLSVSEYQASLSELDTELTPLMTAIAGAKNPTDLSKAATALANAAKERYDKLLLITPPPAAATAHKGFTLALSLFATQAAETSRGSDSGAFCTGAAGLPKLTNGPAVEALRLAITDLAAVDPANPLKVGAWLPAAVAEQSRKLTTGTFVKKGTRNGSGQLKIDNTNGSTDAVMSLALTGTKTTAFSVYVRSGSSFTVNGVKNGTYDTYVSSGVDWDAANSGFSRDCDFRKFDDTMAFDTAGGQYTIWTITLKPATTGNAPTKDVNPADFPQ